MMTLEEYVQRVTQLAQDAETVFGPGALVIAADRWGTRVDRKVVSCIDCNSDDTVYVGLDQDDDSGPYWECRRCRLIFAHLEPRNAA